MSVSRIVWATSVLLAMGAALFVVTRSTPGAADARGPGAVGDRSGSQTDVASRAVRGPAGLQVEVLDVIRKSANDEVVIAASVSPLRRVEIASEVDGRVVEATAEEHSHVLEGDVLVRLERSFLEPALARAEAAVLRARASHDLAKLEHERQKSLRKKRVGSGAELDRAASEERARAAELKEMEALRAEARVRLAKADIRAPFSGFVSRLDLDPGAYLRTGTMVAEIIDLSTIEIEVGVTDREVVGLHEGDAAQLVVDVFPGEVFGGEITSIGRSLGDAQKYPVVVRVPNSEERLLPGMIGQLRLVLASSGEVIRIPRSASVREFELDYVFVVHPDGRAERRRVRARPVPFRPDLLEVVGGLEPGERIAATRTRELRDGVIVEERL